MGLKASLKRFLLKHSGWEGEAWLRNRHASHGRIFADNRGYDTVPTASRVLVLSPHPDDEAIGAGGALLLHKDMGSEILVLYVTDGAGNAGIEGLGSTRKKEARSVGATYEFEQVFWDIPDTKSRPDKQSINKLMGLLTEYRPDLIYLPSFFEKHVDHFICNELVLQAQERLETGIQMLGYEVWNPIFSPNLFLDISQYFEEKKKMLSFYKTPMKDTNYVRLCESRNSLHYFLQNYGEKSGFAEAFFGADQKTYRQCYDSYLKVLINVGSELPQLSH